MDFSAMQTNMDKIRVAPDAPIDATQKYFKIAIANLALMARVPHLPHDPFRAMIFYICHHFGPMTLIKRLFTDCANIKNAHVAKNSYGKASPGGARIYCHSPEITLQSSR
jgi:hypothetical protein